MEKSEAKDKIEKGYFSSIRRVVLVFFLGFSVFLFVSMTMLILLTRPDKEVVVPDVEGKRFVEVYNSLLRKGIRPEIKFKDINDVDDGVIMSQYPESKSIISENSKLKLIVSRSILHIQVPNLIGKRLPIAINKLKNFHFHNKTISIGTGIISYIPSDKTVDNVVIDQSPREGEKITPDQKINLLVSTGKVDTDSKMPDVTGQSIDLCYDLLAAKGLVVYEEIIPTLDKKSSGIVVGQNPGKDIFVKKGSVARIQVNFYKLEKHPYIAYEKVNYTIPPDQKSGLYEAYVEDSKSKRIRFSRNMNPGQMISFIFKRVGNAKILIVRDKKTVRATSIDVD